MAFQSIAVNFAERGRSEAGLICAALVLAIALLAPSAGFGDDKSARAAFLREYQPHAEAVRQYYTNVKVKYIVHADSGGSNLEVLHVEGKFNHLNYLLTGENTLI